MGNFNDHISKFTIKTNSYTPETNSYKILSWCQNNMPQLKNTSLSQVSREALIQGIAQKHFYQTISNLSRHGLIVANRKPLSPRDKRDFCLNYFHKQMPLDIVNRATPEQLAMAKKYTYGKGGLESEKPTQEIENTETNKEPEIENPSVNIPLQPEQLAQGFSLTLNINFNIGK